MKIEKILEMVFAECSRAEQLHPVWPKDLIHGGMTIAEKSGETVKATMDYVEKKGSKQEIITEAIQTISVTIRFLKNIEEENEIHL